MQTHKVIAIANNSMLETGRLALDVKDVVRLTPISRAKLYQLWSQGLGPARLKIGKRTLVRVDALNRWLQQLEDQNNA